MNKLYFPAIMLYMGLSVAILAIAVAGINKPDLMSLMVVLATLVFAKSLVDFRSLAYEVHRKGRPD